MSMVLVNLVCLGILEPPKLLMLASITHCQVDGEILSAFSRLRGFINVSACSSPCIQWEPLRMSDQNGCIDMDLLPTPPRDGAVYWVKEQ